VFILGNFFYAVGYVLRILINLETTVIVIAAILSWIPQLQFTKLYRALRDLADIVERPIRRLVPPLGYIDITPLLAILLLVFLDKFLVQSLIDLGLKLRF